jgi:hypothetical protein
VTDDRAEDLTKSASGDSGAPEPPAANQAKDEPITSSPSDSPQSSATQSSTETDDVRGAANTADGGTLAGAATGGIPTPGDSKGVSVPSVQAAAGTSEESESVEGVRTTALAPPGKPDGEVDTRA